MTNPSSSQTTQSFFHAACRRLSRTIFGGDPDVPVCQKAPPRLSLVQSFVEDTVRPDGPHLAGFEGSR